MPMTIPRPKVLLSWSSGKDSAWAFHVLRQQRDFEVVGLVTTFNEAFDRVAMRAVRRELVEAQAAGDLEAMFPQKCGLPTGRFRAETVEEEDLHGSNHTGSVTVNIRPGSGDLQVVVLCPCLQ